jgi:formyltetrahydrofolate hydrolase
MTTPATLVALLHGPDQPGLVARVSGWIFERGGNILHADQHRDMESGVFFQRVEWVPAQGAASADSTDARRDSDRDSAKKQQSERYLLWPSDLKSSHRAT